MGVLTKLEPASVFHYFEEICSIPHTSHHEKALSDYCVQFAKAHGLACRQDEMGNVLIKAPATPGYENQPALILQGHLDMVGDKTAACPLDLEKDAIQLVVDGEYVRAEGTTLGGSGNMIAVQAALDIGESDMAYALVVDSIDYSIWVMFLLWAINLAPKFNKWVKADTTTLDEVSRRLEEDAKANEDKASFVNLIFLLGLALVISAFGQDIGAALNSAMPFLDKATWTVLLITLSGLIGAVTPVGRMAGSTELSNLLLYSVVALLASRASFLELTDAPAWILAGFMILAIHGIVLVLLAKIFHLDMFTCGVASLANIGGSASAPILAGAYSGALVPVGVLMALMGYVIGTAGGLITANIMSLLA